MAAYLLDADAVIDFINRHTPTVALVEQLILNDERLCTCEVVLAEVYAGLTQRDEERASKFLQTLDFLPGTSESAERAGRWRYQFARRGRVLPTTDALIAATAVEHNVTIVTGNVRDYLMPEVSLLPLPR